MPVSRRVNARSATWLGMVMTIIKKSNKQILTNINIIETTFKSMKM